MSFTTIVTQSSITGAVGSGVRDGRWTYNIAPLGTDYQVGGPIIAGHEAYLGYNWYHNSWVRFKVPLEKDANRVVEDCYLTLWWWGNDPPNVGIGSPPNKMGVTLCGPDQSSTFPATRVAANSLYDACITAGQGTTWEDSQLTSNAGTQGGALRTVNLKDQMQLILDQSAWAYDEHVMFFLSHYYISSNFIIENLGVNRYWMFRTWSRETLWAGGNTRYAPELTIKWRYETPLPAVYDQHIEHELEIEQYQVETGIRGTIENTLTFDQDVEGAVTYNRAVTHDLLIDQDVTKGFAIETETYEDAVTLEQTIEVAHVQYVDLESDLTITQTIDANAELQANIESELTIEQDIEVVYVQNASIEDTLTITQDVRFPGLFDLVVWSELAIGQDVDVLATLATPNDVTQTVTIEQDISAEGSVYNREVEHTLTIEDALVGWNGNQSQVGSCTRKDLLYDPQTTDGDFTTSLVSLGDGLGVTLSYPTTSPTHSVTLPSPVMGNVEEFLKMRIQRKTRGGKLITYTAPSWPTSETFRMSFDTLSDTQRDDFVTLVEQSFGKPIKLVDHEGRDWNLLLINPNGDILEVQRDCGHVIEFHAKVVP